MLFYESPSFGPDYNLALEERLTGCALREDAILQTLEGFPLSYYIQGLTAGELAEALTE